MISCYCVYGACTCLGFMLLGLSKSLLEPDFYNTYKKTRTGKNRGDNQLHIQSWKRLLSLLAPRSYRKRIDEYCDEKEAGFTKNCFKIGMIRIINLWGNYNPLPETFTMNLTKNGLWALGAIELPTLIIDELTAELNAKSGKCDKKDHEKGAPEIVLPRSFTKSTKKKQKKLLPQVLRTVTITKGTIQLVTCNQRRQVIRNSSTLSRWNSNMEKDQKKRYKGM